MKTATSHLPAGKQAELKAIKEALIPRYAEIEMIILFGSYARGNWVEDKYVENGITYEYKSDYDLLIVLNTNSKADAPTFTQSITGKIDELKLGTPTHPIYHGIEFINAELSEGNYFFNDIKTEGIVLFTSNRYELAEKRELSKAELQKHAQEDFEEYFNSANEFLDTTGDDIRKERYKKAAFELHQATERYYNAIQLVFTRYKPKTHDLEILGKQANSFDMRFIKVFPTATPEEARRFTLLKKAYVDARYKKNYTITKDDLTYLGQRVGILKTLAEEICKEKIKGFV